MFKKNDFKLKKDFRKLLWSTNEFYHTQIKDAEERAVIYMWNKIIRENGCIGVTRFKKQDHRLGIMISTEKSKLGNLHEIVNIAENGCVSRLPSIQTGDILLEVNGVNLLLLNYAQLVLTLSGLPNNIQFVFWKKEAEGVYERPDILDFSSANDPYHLSKDSDDMWVGTVKILVQCTRTKTHGLNFIDSIDKKRNYSKCVIQKINPDGYFFEDQRVSVNDSIVELNQRDVHLKSDEEMIRLLTVTKNSAILLEIRKYHTGWSGSDVMSLTGSKRSWTVNQKETFKNKPFIHSTPNLKTSKSFFQSTRTLRSEQNLTKEERNSHPSIARPTDYQTLKIKLDSSDDLKMYLVDVKEGEQQKSVICGFKPDSNLPKKLRFKDEIVKINDEDVRVKTSKEIGLRLKTYSQNKVPITISIIRKTKADTLTFDNSLILSQDMISMESDYRSTTYGDYSRNISPDGLNGSVVYVTLYKSENTFGIRVENLNGPTITEIIPGSSTHKNCLVKVDDKIIKINNIYVLDKEQSFVLTMIRSCSQRMNLELLRKSSVDSNIQFVENQIYFPTQNSDSNDARHSAFLPLPDVPENVESCIRKK